MNYKIIRVLNCASLYLEGFAPDKIIYLSNKITPEDVKEGINLGDLLQNRYINSNDETPFVKNSDIINTLLLKKDFTFKELLERLHDPQNNESHVLKSCSEIYLKNIIAFMIKLKHLKESHLIYGRLKMLETV